MNIIGNRYERLVVLSPEQSRGGRSRWLCLCDCGKTVVVAGGHLQSGNTRSCGCLRLPYNAPSDSIPEYGPWKAMKQRCHCPKDKDHHRYGGRGIIVCDRWRESFAAFLQDVGPRPSLAHSLDRYPNKDGNYEPGNVRWATAKQQANNRRPRQRKVLAVMNCDYCGRSFQKKRDYGRSANHKFCGLECSREFFREHQSRESTGVFSTIGL